MKHEKIMEKALNKSAIEINNMYSILVQSIRNFISRNIMDATEEHPIECEIPVEYYSNHIEIDKIFPSDDGSGYIFLHAKGDHPDQLIELDDLNIEDRITIVNYLN